METTCLRMLSGAAARLFAILLLCSSTAAPQAWEWADGTCSTNALGVTAIDIDLGYNGNTYIVGRQNWGGSVTFKTVPLTILTSATGNTIYFLAAYDPNGQCLWAVELLFSPNALAYCRYGDYIYVVGGGNIAKYDQNGSLLSNNKIGGANGVDIQDIGIGYGPNSSYSIYITGGFSGTPTFTRPSGATITLNTIGREIFAARLRSDLYASWATQVTRPSSSPLSLDNAESIVIDNSGSCYIRGWLFGTGIFGTTTLNPAQGREWIAKLHPYSGAFLWATIVLGGVNNEGWVSEIDVSPSGAVYAVGTIEGSGAKLRGMGANSVQLQPTNRGAFIAQYNANGVLQWAQLMDGAAAEFGNGLACSDGGVAVACELGSKKVVFGQPPNSFEISSSYNAAVAYYDEFGDVQWVKQTQGLDYERAIAIAGNGGLWDEYVVVGEFSQVAFFGSNSIAFCGHQEAFVAKLNHPELVIPDDLADGGLEPNQGIGGFVGWTSYAIFNTKGAPDVQYWLHENPEFGEWNYLNVYYMNQTSAPVKGQIHLYYTKSSTGNAWDPTSSGPVLYGNWTKLGASIAVNLTTFQDDFGYVKWWPPGVGDYCLLARFESDPSHSDPMTYPEVIGTVDNVRKNNNITAKNVVIVDNSKKKCEFVVRNICPGSAIIDLNFRPTIPAGSLEDIELLIDLDDNLMGLWQEGGNLSEGVEIVVLEGDTILRVFDPAGAWLRNMPFDSGVEYTARLQFRIIPDVPSTMDSISNIDVVQFSSFDGGPSELDGGIRYQIDREAFQQEKPTIGIEKTHNAIQGQFEYVSITTEGHPLETGGFDFLIAYDASVLTFMGVEPGQLLEDCDWEYFTYRYGADGNCGDACPSGLLRIIAVAETNNGSSHPSCFNPPDSEPHELAEMKFLVTNDRTYECQYAPIRFFWSDCGDNSISSVDGNELYVDRAVYDHQQNLIWHEDDDDQFPEEDRSPGVGAPDYCLNPDPDKPSALRFIDFVNGGVDIICADSIDARGDINVNGLAYEIADAVTLTDYFISGERAFGNHVEASIAASDVNADGIPLSVADLVHLIRIITGDAPPFPKLGHSPQEVEISALVNHSAVGISTVSPTDIGAGVFVFEHSGYDIGEPHLVNGSSDMSLVYSDDAGILTVLVYSLDKNVKILSGSENVFVIPIRGDGVISLTNVDLADYYGNAMTARISDDPQLPVTYMLHQNYPNPFNASTIIIYETPYASHVTVEVFNVLGQKVTTLVDRDEAAGVHTIRWNGDDESGATASSGVYLYSIVAGDFTSERKMVMVK